MFQREYIVKNAVQTSNSQTYTKELPKSGALSRINLRFEATNGATSNKDSEIFRCVSKIELIANGSETLISLTAQEAFRLAWLKGGEVPPNLMSEDLSKVQHMEFPIDFGRYLGDKSYYLDLAKYTTVEMRVTYNLAAVNAVGATGFVSGTATINMIAHRALPGEMASSRGYLRSTEIKTFTSVASGIEVIELPLKHKYVGVGIYAYESAVADNTDITKVDLILDKGARTLFTGDWDHIQEENKAMFHVDPTVKGVAFKSDTDTIETFTGTVIDHKVQFEQDANVAGDAFSVLNVDTVAGGLLTLNASTATIVAGSEALTANTTDDTIKWNASGVGVGNFVYIPIDILGDFEGTLDSKRYTNIDLELTQSAAGATVGVVLEELVAY